MILTLEQRETVASELKKIAADLNLSDEQKQNVSNFLTEAHETIVDYKQQDPNASREDLVKKIAANRTAIRERVANFLTPEQLNKWDAAVANAKEFLGQKVAAYSLMAARVAGAGISLLATRCNCFDPGSAAVVYGNPNMELLPVPARLRPYSCCI